MNGKQQMGLLFHVDDEHMYYVGGTCALFIPKAAIKFLGTRSSETVVSSTWHMWYQGTFTYQ